MEGLGIVTKEISKRMYIHALREEPSIGLLDGERPDITLEEARVELAREVSKFAKGLLKDWYGPLIVAISEPTVTELLKNFETNFVRAKGDITILLEEIIDRLTLSKVKKKTG